MPGPVELKNKRVLIVGLRAREWHALFAPRAALQLRPRIRATRLRLGTPLTKVRDAGVKLELGDTTRTHFCSSI